MNNLTQRICSAAALILILVVLIHPATTIPIKATAVGFISLIILWEYSRLFKSRFHPDSFSDTGYWRSFRNAFFYWIPRENKQLFVLVFMFTMVIHIIPSINLQKEEYP